GSLSLLHRVDQGLSNLSGAGTERADLVVEGAISYDSPLEQVRQLVPASLTTVIESIDGVAATDPRIEDTAVIVGPDNEPIVPLGITERPAGASWPTVPELSPYQFVGEGAPPVTDDEVAIDETTANAGDLQVGDQVGIITKSTFGTYTITGIVTLDGTPMPPGSSLALFEIDTARQLFDREDDVNAIGVLLEEGESVSEMQAQIQAAMPPAVEVSTPAVYEQHRQTSLAKSFTLIEVLLLGFAGLAVVVGAFTVANSNALLFARRRHGFALLRLVGASPRQLLGSALVEAALVGVLAVLVGLPLGLLAGAAIEQAIGALGAAIPTAGSAVSPTMLAIAAVVGMAVTVATAVAPAWDAARTTPVAALNRNDERRERSAPWVARVGGWLLAGAVIGAVVGAVLTDGVSGPAIGAAIGAGVFALLALLPPVLGGLIALTTRLMVGRSRTLRSLTALRSRRARSRASSTTAALMIATLVIASLSTLSASFVSSISGEVQEAVTADLVVDSGTFTRGGLPADLVEELEQADGVAAATGVRLGRANVAGYPARLSAIDGDDVFEVLDLGVADQPSALAADEIAISDEFAQSTGTAVGQMVTVDFVNAVQPVTVAAIYTKGSALLGDGIIDTSVLERTTPTSVDLLALVALEPGREPEGTANTTSIAESYGVTQVLAPQELVDERAELLSGFQRVIEWMLLFSVGLAVIGVANTLQLSVNERRRELGLLRAVGASRRQVIRLVLVEAGALSVVGAVLGIALGVGLAFGAVTALSDLGLDKFALPVLALAATAVAAVVLGLSGALLPALRASGAGILEAIGEDEDSSTTMLSRISQFRIRRRSRSLMRGPSRADRVYREATPAPPPGDGAAEPDADTEETMATRCYNCGNDPGSGDRCQVCDASQIPEPLGMFSTAPAAAGAQPPRPAAVDPATQSRPSGGLWSTGDDTEEPAAENGHRTPTTDERFADIVDAAIVDDDDVYESHRDRPRESAPHAPHAPRAEAPVDDRHEAPREPAEDHSAQLGSIFDGDPSDAARSPFGRHANDAPSEPEWSPEWSPDWPADEPPPAPAPQPQYQVPPPSYPPP
ncbi:MAG TPA: FtsX-like permease family protein, partial [Microthrixaceae bacterium]|nr:FtsX-like permease family protein [Microthrixaceae bacterium]